ncbi:MAG: hypothetical protein V1663_01740 [archaeon]
MVLFSERFGYKSIKTKIQIVDIDTELTNGIWNCFITHIFDKFKDYEIYKSNAGYYSMQNLIERLWLDFFKKPIDEKPTNRRLFLQVIRGWFFNASKWNEKYDFVEFVLHNHDNSKEVKELIEDLNAVLKRELAGYRIISSIVTPITSDVEINEIEKAANTPINEVNQHIDRSLELMSDRKKPDYRNSIKESISAVETICRIISKKDKATLVDALKKLQKDNKIKFHGALQSAFTCLYGYTSDADGIRHSLMGEENLDFEDASFFLVSCSAFINYLLIKKSKIE